MNYRMTQEFKPPFRINALIEEAGPLRVSKISSNKVIFHIVELEAQFFLSLG